MAVQWGSNSLGPGEAQGWFFIKPNAMGFLPVLSVVPTSPDFTDMSYSYTGTGELGLQGISFPIQTALGVSTIWSKLSDDGTQLVYAIVVFNFSNSTVEYSFLEGDL